MDAKEKALQFFTTPATGFHFAVAFELFPLLPSDILFQEVSGLNAKVETEAYVEGGENRFAHALPGKTSYGPLVLKRGFLIGSGIRLWCINAIENYEFQPTNITILLLNESHIPLNGWYVTNAYPVDWTIGAFDAQDNKILVESITLNYNYFKSISVEAFLAKIPGPII